jgi:hypothetical protein
MILRKKEPQMIRIHPFKERRKKIPIWWPMEGKGKTPFHLFPLSPKKFYLNLHFFLWYWSLIYHGSRPLLTHFLIFPWPTNYNCASWCNKSFTHSLLIWFWLKIYFPFLEIMASRMVTSYEPQATQVNEESAPKLFLNLTLTQHFRDEDLEPRNVHVCLEVDPPWVWYYRIFSNFHTLVILS